MKLIKTLNEFGSFTVGVESGEQVLDYGYKCSVRGVALLFYKPQKRLSVSVWGKNFSKNIRLWGPKKLSWEK